jgi:hypothetical protein
MEPSADQIEVSSDVASDLMPCHITNQRCHSALSWLKEARGPAMQTRTACSTRQNW